MSPFDCFQKPIWLLWRHAMAISLFCQSNMTAKTFEHNSSILMSFNMATVSLFRQSNMAALTLTNNLTILMLFNMAAISLFCQPNMAAVTSMFNFTILKLFKMAPTSLFCETNMAAPFVTSAKSWNLIGWNFVNNKLQVKKFLALDNIVKLFNILDYLFRILFLRLLLLLDPNTVFFPLSAWCLL